ncbi:MAG: response regulator [Candidatus Aureabacteria bacterium]|nr:response regulator [Candidatus Auribacterota bacterium]
MAKKILIVDDDVDFVEAIKTLLETKNYEVFSAENGMEGFNQAKNNKPDLIILDVMMATKTEGFDIARKLQKESSTKGTPVIMITGIRKEMSLPFGFEPNEDFLPVKAVLEKPIKPEILLKKIEESI